MCGCPCWNKNIAINYMQILHVKNWTWHGCAKLESWKAVVHMWPLRTCVNESLVRWRKPLWPSLLGGRSTKTNVGSGRTNPPSTSPDAAALCGNLQKRVKTVCLACLITCFFHSPLGAHVKSTLYQDINHNSHKYRKGYWSHQPFKSFKQNILWWILKPIVDRLCITCQGSRLHLLGPKGKICCFRLSVSVGFTGDGGSPVLLTAWIKARGFGSQPLRLSGAGVTPRMGKHW